MREKRVREKRVRGKRVRGKVRERKRENEIKIEKTQSGRIIG